MVTFVHQNGFLKITYMNSNLKPSLSTTVFEKCWSFPYLDKISKEDRK